MRRALETPNRTTQTLDDEVDYVTDYVEIEKLRLGNRLRFEWDIAPAAEAAQIPPFILQTLVENSILHGIAPKLTPGRVRVTARVHRNGHVLVAVSDDGVGIAANERQAALRDGDVALRRQGHGLRLSSEQLCLIYGRGARVRLFSRRDVGTIAAFCLPPSALPVPAARAVSTRTTGRPTMNRSAGVNNG